MTFPFDISRPAANNAPADDQPVMQTNNSSTFALIAVDHVTFNNSTGGQHQQITLPNNNIPGSAPTFPKSIEYTQPGVANTASSDAYLYNSAGKFPMNIIRAAGSFLTTISPGGVSFISSVNCSTITVSGTGPRVYAITLTAGSVTGNNVMVFFESSANTNSAISTYSFSGGVLSLTISNIASSIISFMIVQI